MKYKQEKLSSVYNRARGFPRSNCVRGILFKSAYDVLMMGVRTEKFMWQLLYLILGQVLIRREMYSNFEVEDF